MQSNQEEEKEELETIEHESEYCSICMDIFLEPVSIPCGHTFCMRCLLRHLKTKRQCPLCRVYYHSSAAKLPINLVLDEIIRSKYPKRVKKREQEINQIIEEEQTQVQRIHGIPCISLKQKVSLGWTLFFKFTQRKYMDMVQMILTTDRRFLYITNTKNKNTPEEENYGYIGMLLDARVQERSILAQIVFIQRLKAGRKYIPPEREGLYSNEADALFFCDGIIIEDKKIYDQDEFQQTIDMAIAIHDIYKNKKAQIPLNLARDLVKNHGSEPIYNPNFSHDSMEKYASNLSLYLCPLLRSSSDDFFQISFSTNTQERLAWCRSKLTSVENPIMIFNYATQKEGLLQKPLHSFLFIVGILILLWYFTSGKNNKTFY